MFTSLIWNSTANMEVAIIFLYYLSPRVWSPEWNNNLLGKEGPCHLLVGYPQSLKRIQLITGIKCHYGTRDNSDLLLLFLSDKGFVLKSTFLIWPSAREIFLEPTNPEALFNNCHSAFPSTFENVGHSSSCLPPTQATSNKATREKLEGRDGPNSWGWQLLNPSLLIITTEEYLF